MRLKIAVERDAPDLSAEIAAITAGGSDIGAIATFTGLCRSEKGALTGLELEHYPGMAETEIERIAGLAAARWPLDALTVIHRHGMMRPGDVIVLVIAASSHRAAAFAACEFVMDFLKTSAPFWKKEERTDGAPTAWVAAKDADDSAAARWLDNNVTR